MSNLKKMAIDTWHGFSVEFQKLDNEEKRGMSDVAAAILFQAARDYETNVTNSGWIPRTCPPPRFAVLSGVPDVAIELVDAFASCPEFWEFSKDHPNARIKKTGVEYAKNHPSLYAFFQ